MSEWPNKRLEATRGNPLAPQAKRWASSMSESRPRNVTIASGLLIVDALFGALSVNVLAHFSGRTEHVLQFHALVWVPALLQIIAAVLLMRRRSWVRYAVAAVVLLLVIDSALNTSWPQAYASFPGATLRDAASFLLQILSVGLLLSPAASSWFNRAPTSPTAA